jgi:hypothetical protein
MSNVDEFVTAAATEFVQDVFAEPYWRGREHEAVSHFALFLQRQCREQRVLHNPAQIVIGGCVPGVPELNPKGRVNKDMVLWPQPRMSCWNADWIVANIPMAVLEWKVFRLPKLTPKMSAYDLHWLQHFSRHRPDFVGYAVALDLRARKWRLRVDRVQNGSTHEEWLRL